MKNKFLMLRTARFWPCVVMMVWVLAHSPLAAEDWLRFRGPNGSATSEEKGLPLTWSGAENIVWKTPLPGPGASSPIVVDNRVFVTCYSGYGVDRDNPGDQSALRLHLICADRATGKIRWDQVIEPSLPEENLGKFMKLHGYASGTPASDGQVVYAFFGRTGVFAFDLDGHELWRADVGEGTHGFGTGTSPILYKNLVIVNASVESSCLIALDKQSGREVWRAPEIMDSWNTPVLVGAGRDKQELVLDTKDRLRGFDPETGEMLWHCKGPNDPRYICPSPVAGDGIVYALHGYFGPMVAVETGGRSDVGSTHERWRSEARMGSNVPSPLLHEGYLYWTNEKGGVFCVNAKTGQEMYKGQLDPKPDLVYASPVAADGKLYYVSRTGGTYVLAAKPEFELLAHNTIATDDSVFNASPVVCGSRLLLRSDRFLYCIE